MSTVSEICDLEINASSSTYYAFIWVTNLILTLKRYWSWNRYISVLRVHVLYFDFHLRTNYNIFMYAACCRINVYRYMYLPSCTVHRLSNITWYLFSISWEIYEFCFWVRYVLDFLEQTGCNLNSIVLEI